MPWLDLEAEIVELFHQPHVLSGDMPLRPSLSFRESRGMLFGRRVKDYAAQWTGAAPAPGLPDYRTRTRERVEAEHRKEQARKLAQKHRRYATDPVYRARVCATRNASRARCR